MHGIIGCIWDRRAGMYRSSEDGLCLTFVTNTTSVNGYDKILHYLHFLDNYAF